MRPKTEKDLPKVSRQKRGTESKEVSRERSVLDGWYPWIKEVRPVRWHGVLRETLKAHASNFVLDPCFNWKPVECSKQ